MLCDWCNEIREFTETLLHYYMDRGHSVNSKVAEVQKNAVLCALDDFCAEREHEYISFSLELRTEHELRYISFEIANDHIEVSEGGSVYDPHAGSDSYTLWTFILWDSGESEGTLSFDFSKAVEMIDLGARIDFDAPDDLREESILVAFDEEKEKKFLDSLCCSYECLMERFAEPIVRRIVNKVKRELQSFDRDSGMMQSHEDSGLKNVWDELCAQVQGEESVFYSAYLDVVESIINGLLDACQEDEKIILWTQTQDYEEWKDNH